jgi:hypothetical protein
MSELIDKSVATLNQPNIYINYVELYCRKSVVWFLVPLAYNMALMVGCAVLGFWRATYRKTSTTPSSSSYRYRRRCSCGFYSCLPTSWRTTLTCVQSSSDSVWCRTLASRSDVSSFASLMPCCLCRLTRSHSAQQPTTRSRHRRLRQPLTQ